MAFLLRRLAPSMASMVTRGQTSMTPVPAMLVKGFASTAAAEPAKKVVVFGGNGYVGSHVCQALLALGGANKVTQIVSINRSGQPTSPEWDHWWQKVEWVKADALEPDEWKEHLEGATGVVSCVGAFGSDAFMEQICGDATVGMVKAARAAKVQNFAFVSAHDYKLPLVLKGYYSGKKKAEEAVAAHFPNTGVSVRPAFVHGTRQFNKVPLHLGLIGEPLETVLRSEKVRKIATEYAHMSFTKLLAPPVSVKDVATVMAYAAVGAAPKGTVDALDIRPLAEKLRAT